MSTCNKRRVLLLFFIMYPSKHLSFIYNTFFLYIEILHNIGFLCNVVLCLYSSLCMPHYMTHMVFIIVPSLLIERILYIYFWLILPRIQNFHVYTKIMLCTWIIPWLHGSYINIMFILYICHISPPLPRVNLCVVVTRFSRGTATPYYVPYEYKNLIFHISRPLGFELATSWLTNGIITANARLAFWPICTAYFIYIDLRPVIIIKKKYTKKCIGRDSKPRPSKTPNSIVPPTRPPSFSLPYMCTSIIYIK